MTTPGGIAWRAKIFKTFGIVVPPQLGAVVAPRVEESFGLACPVGFGFGVNSSESIATFRLSVPPSMEVQYPRAASFGLSLPINVDFAGKELYTRSVTLSVAPDLNFAGSEKYQRNFGLSFVPDLNFNGAATLPPIAFDAFSNATPSAGSSISWTANAAAGSYVIVDLVANPSTTVTVSNVKYGTLNMTLLGSVPFNNVGTNGAMFRYGLANAPGGSQTVSATFSGGSWYEGSAASYTNVGSVGATTTVYGTGTALSQSVTLAANKRVVQSFGQGSSGTTLSSLSGGTNRYNHYNNFVGLTVNDAAATTTFTGTASGQSSDVWCGIATVLNGL
ncbi:hypothetical protein R2325_16460 [Mycobacteroides chelonae]|uniref:hypothetical protein n=1 Tax=Mycobacteroides chelonae TaxID=1774 RepID=UPI002DF2846B|nr:hypothetical protein [Mycobacteroides chelonae]MEC4873577.1 hypothetical protein [Mycobacteroides chelonae]